MKTYLSLFACFMLASCGGGTSSISPSQTPVAVANDVAPETESISKFLGAKSINPVQKGQLFYLIDSAGAEADEGQKRIQLMEIDIRTGIETLSVGSAHITAETSLGASTAIADNNQSINVNSDEYVFRISRDAQLLTASRYVDVTLLVPGNIGQYYPYTYKSRALAFSPSGKISFSKSHRIESMTSVPYWTFVASYNSIFDLSGKLLVDLSKTLDANAKFISDDQIVHAVGPELFFVKISDNASRLVKRFSDPVSAVQISNDKQKIAIELAKSGAIWTMNADGTNIQQLFESTSDQQSLFSLAIKTFSPDGLSLLVAISDASPVPKPIRRVYALPIGQGKAFSIGTIPDEMKLKFLDGTTGATTDVAPNFGDLFWLDLTTPRAGFKVGSVASGDGLNRGLQGRVLDNQAQAIDLATGLSTSVLPKTPWSRSFLGASASGSEIWTKRELLSDYDTNDANAYAASLDTYTFWSADGKATRQIFSPVAQCGEMALATSKRFFACAALYFGQPLNRLRILDLDLKTVTAEITDSSKALWLADDRLLVLNQSKNELAIIGTNFLERKTLFKNDFPFELLNVSKSGSKILIRKDKQVWSMNIDGSALSQLTDSSSLVTSAVFSSDQKFVLLGAKVGLSQQVWAVPADGVRVPVFNQAVKNTSGFAIQRNANLQPSILGGGDLVGWY
jgi:hypothetical protein